jgi:hypothetical protein
MSQRNRPDGENIVPAGRRDFDGAFDMLLAFELAKIKILISRSDIGPTVNGANRLWWLPTRLTTLQSTIGLPAI